MSLAYATEMRVHQWTGDLLTVLLFSGLAAGGILSGISITPVRVALALPLVLLVPGYAFISSLFPEAPDDDGTGFGTLERLVLSIALSLALVAMIAYVANFTPYGITLLPITVGVVAWTVLFSLLGLLRRARLPGEKRYRPTAGAHLGGLTGLFTVQSRRPGETRGAFEPESGRHVLLNGFLVFSVLVLLVGGAYMAVAAPSLPNEEPHTEFYLLSENGEGELTSTDLPTDLSAGETAPITVAIENHEGERVTYTTVVYQQQVTLSDDGRTVESVDGSEELDRFETTVDADETDQVAYEAGPTADGDVYVWFLLYHGDVPDDPSPENADETTRLTFAD
ncbi:DUF1616 domain-containing protein [Halalkalicoccus jeotgali]|uniref:DUF1616 domain-containing protein n=1 Tax=Halalkalicoccus jeotgali (strain DSM 18796 / CECT 7217 / JCM 14584 / KCTC 4019 / B3) TaxID=795797 RepID=D8J5R5_HALJB|nr:DUF1616 domain-containing protein [Halalkalicoccus jeotgali]ADJ13721.1 hypothetical protein HacjB3_01640 [Halalkalicoccus jeotgali B3]ELY34232.1 hypothetical protein C497_17682 [Halalkalicoccus jeotgali B3]